MCRRQAAESQCSGPGRRVTADVCSKEKDDFCQETCEMPIVSWKYLHELEGREGGVQRHVQAAGRREPIQSPGKKSDCRRVQQEKDDFCQETYEMPIVSWKYSHELEGRGGGVHSHVQATGRR